jgi:hypothetical protein
VLYAVAHRRHCRQVGDRIRLVLLDEFRRKSRIAKVAFDEREPISRSQVRQCARFRSGE